MCSFCQLLGEPGTGGSSTPSMVGAVRKWQKADPRRSSETWKNLAESNSALETQFNLLSNLAKENWDVYKNVIQKCSLLKADKVLIRTDTSSLKGHLSLLKYFELDKFNLRMS